MFGPLGMPCLEKHLQIEMTLTLKPGELVLKLLTILDSLLDAWMLEFMVQYAIAQFVAAE